MSGSLKIHFDEKTLEVIKSHLEKSYPNEGCGFLFGKNGEIRHFTLAGPVINSKDGDQRRRFEISAENYMKAEIFALENDLELLGIFHSHPNHPAIPSEHDLAAAFPFFSYLILSVMNGKSDKMTSWRLNKAGTAFEEEQIVERVRINE